MEFRDLKTQYLENKKAIDAAIEGVLLGSHFIGGDPINQLEEKLSDYVGVKHCITCANGTDALQLALMAWGVGNGDAVFVPDFTFFSTAEVVPWVGATPVFVDVDQDTFNISVKSLEEAIQNVIKEGRIIPKVIVAVDLFGQPADFFEIRQIAKKYNMVVLEDGAQGFGGRIGEQKACSFGDIATTSFFPAKPLGCYGDGGAVFTNDDEWATLIRSYKVHGKGKDKYDNERIGMNSRLDTIQAAILLQKLEIFEKMELKAVDNVARSYGEKIENEYVKVPKILDGFSSSWAQYTICVSDKEMRNKMQTFLKNKGIPTMIYYPIPLHHQRAFKNIDFRRYDNICINTVQLCERVLSLPMHPYMKEEDVRTVVNSIERGIDFIIG